MFTRYPKKLTIEMVKWVTVLINSFNRQSGEHSVMPPRQILIKTKFKNPLCKIGELVMVYNVTAENKSARPRAFMNYASE